MGRLWGNTLVPVYRGQCSNDFTLKDCQHVEFVRRAYGNANRKYPDYTKSRAVDDNGIVLLFTASCDRLDISSSLTLRKQDLIYLLTYGQVLQRGDPL